MLQEKQTSYGDFCLTLYIGFSPWYFQLTVTVYIRSKYLLFGEKRGLALNRDDDICLTGRWVHLRAYFHKLLALRFKNVLNHYRQYVNVIHHLPHLTIGGSCFSHPVVMLIFALVNPFCFSFPIIIQVVWRMRISQPSFNSVWIPVRTLLVYLSISSCFTSPRSLSW